MEKYNEHSILDDIINHKTFGIGIVFISSFTFLYLLFLIMMGLYVSL